MTTTQMIIAGFAFLVSMCVALIAYIWKDAKDAIKDAVTKEHCKTSHEQIEEKIDMACSKIKKHRHTDEGKVEVEL